MKKWLADNKEDILRIIRMCELVLSVLLIVFISVDTFRSVNFLENHEYMVFQFWVCMSFIFFFFVEVYYAERRLHHFFTHLLFLVICIPYLNLVNVFHLQLGPQELFFVRFIPLARGALALAIIISYTTNSRITNLFFSYFSIMLLVVYFASLIFLEQESPVNPEVHDYWTSLWWCLLETTTIGAPINPMTVVGKVLAGVLAAMGMIMFPLFTVYLSSIVKRYIKS